MSSHLGNPDLSPNIERSYLGQNKRIDYISRGIVSSDNSIPFGSINPITFTPSYDPVAFAASEARLHETIKNFNFN
jgi:hypothetical protein